MLRMHGLFNSEKLWTLILVSITSLSVHCHLLPTSWGGFFKYTHQKNMVTYKSEDKAWKSRKTWTEVERQNKMKTKMQMHCVHFIKVLSSFFQTSWELNERQKVNFSEQHIHLCYQKGSNIPSVQRKASSKLAPVWKPNVPMQFHRGSSLPAGTQPSQIFPCIRPS